MLKYVKGLSINCYNPDVDFHEWMNKKYIEWRGDSRERNQTQFAAWLGISDSLLTSYLDPKGRKPKQKGVIDKLIRRYGSEVYKILNLPQPPEFVQMLEEIEYEYPDLTVEQQKKLLRRISEIYSDLKKED